MFLHVSVILFTGGCLAHCMLGYTPLTRGSPPQQTPPLDQAPSPQTRSPLEQTPPQTRHPLPRTRPPHTHSAVHAWKYGQQAGGMHPTGMQSCNHYYFVHCKGWVSASTLRQLCDETNDNILIENNGVTQKWVATPFCRIFLTQNMLQRYRFR